MPPLINYMHRTIWRRPEKTFFVFSYQKLAFKFWIFTIFYLVIALWHGFKFYHVGFLIVIVATYVIIATLGTMFRLGKIHKNRHSLSKRLWQIDASAFLALVVSVSTIIVSVIVSFVLFRNGI